MDSIYINKNKKSVELLIMNDSLSNLIQFDGLTFSFVKKERVSFENYEKIDTSFKNETSENVKLIGLKEEEDLNIYYLALDNGTIFQIYHTPLDDTFFQKIEKFSYKEKKISTPLGVSVYDAIKDNYNDAETYEDLDLTLWE